MEKNLLKKVKKMAVIKKINNKMKIKNIRYIVQIIYAILLFFSFIVSLKFFLILTLIFTILGGSFYCGWLCPFGTLQELIYDFSSKFFKKKPKLPNFFKKYFVFLRYIFFILSLFLIGFVFLIDARISFIDVILGNKISIISYLALIFFILISFVYNRFFCNYFCIQGARFGLFSSLRIFRIKRDSSKCINCKICDNICPMNIKISNKNYINSLQCINCFECIDNCPKKETLKYSVIKLNKNTFEKIKQDLFEKK